MHGNNQFQSSVVRFIVDGVAEQTARSLELLRAIETTVQVNQMLTEAFEQNNARLSAAIAEICSRQADQPQEPIDADSTIRASIEQTLDTTNSIVSRLKGARLSAVEDGDLCHEDGVVESFDLLINALVDAHEALNELNWAIMEHDADRSPVSGKGPFKSAKDLLATLV